MYVRACSCASCARHPPVIMRALHRTRAKKKSLARRREKRKERAEMQRARRRLSSSLDYLSTVERRPADLYDFFLSLFLSSHRPRILYTYIPPGTIRGYKKKRRNSDAHPRGKRFLSLALLTAAAMHEPRRRSFLLHARIAGTNRRGEIKTRDAFARSAVPRVDREEAARAVR